MQVRPLVPVVVSLQGRQRDGNPALPKPTLRNSSLKYQSHRRKRASRQHLLSACCVPGPC